MNNSILLRLMLAMLAIVFAFPSTAADSKPRKPPRGTITRLIDGDSNLVVRIEEQVRAKQFVGKFADEMFEQVMFHAWPGDFEIAYRVNAPGREWHLFLVKMRVYGKTTSTSPRSKFDGTCHTNHRQYFAIDSTTKRIEPYTYLVSEKTCGKKVEWLEGKWFEPLRIFLPGRFTVANRADLPQPPTPPSPPPVPEIPIPNESDLAPLKRRIGTKLCKTETDRTFIGFTEGVSPDMDRIQIRVVAANSRGLPLEFREQVIWDAPANWRLCE